MTISVIGRKLGMTRVFTDNGDSLPVTVVEIPKNIITNINSLENNNHSSYQVSAFPVKETKLNKPKQGFYKKKKLDPMKKLKEFTTIENINLEVGSDINVSHFPEGTYVDVRSKSKGKGFAGTIKRHNFKGKDATHGNSISHRTPGSTGQCQFPGRVFKGKKMAGQMGNKMVTKKNLKVVKVDSDKNLLIIKGSIPGFIGRDVYISTSPKNQVNANAD
ncbi:MAG: 50S ribosomal protein L3 [Gammaproteobacteria bacterium]|nr:50S ribosomal protein L3 [Gammaproteobacteria bacterium]|tara:strand:- start:1275 stop:1928 length:654 start_codon:yes stop_codon:yes gene_type:complete